MQFNLDTLTVLSRGEERSTSPVLRTVVLSSFNEAKALSRDWSDLADAAGSTLYQTPEWLLTWWKYFGHDGRRVLHIIAFYHVDRLVGLAPMFVESNTIAGVNIHKALRMLGCGNAYRLSGGILLDDGPSDYLDFLVVPEYAAAVAQEFVAYWTNVREFDELEFVNARPDGCIARDILPFLQSAETDVRVSIADRCSVIEIPETVEAYIQSRDPHMRRRLKRAQKTLEGSNGTAIAEVTTEHEACEAFDLLVRLHQRRWNVMGYPGVFWSAQMRDFQSEVMLSLLKKGWSSFKIVTWHQTPVAVRLGYRHAERIYDYLSGFDEASPAAKERPGFALLLSMMADARARGLSRLELLRGDESYKAEMTATSFHNANILVRRTSSVIRQTLYRIYAGVRLISFTARRELSLLQVQYKVHGPLSCLYHFLMFRLNRLAHKVRLSEQKEMA